MDTMLSGINPTMDDGTIRISIAYEDENGVAAEPVEKELTLIVTEDMGGDWDMGMDPGMEVGGMDMEGQTSFWGKYKVFIIAGAAAAVAAGIIITLRIRKKRKAAREEDIDDEIS